MGGEHVRKVLRRGIPASVGYFRGRKRCVLKKPACRFAPVSYDFLLDAQAELPAENFPDGRVGIPEMRDHVVRRYAVADMPANVHERVGQPRCPGGIEGG